MAEKIVFFHMNQLGDLLFSLPLLAAARRADAAASAVSVIRAPLAPLLEATGLVDRVIVKHRGASAFVRRISALRREGFSRAVLFSESPESLVAAYCSGIPARYGFRTASLGFLLTRSAGRTGVPSLGNNRALAAELGLRDCPADYTGLVKIPAERVEAQRRWCGAEGIDPACLVVVAPGASRRRKDKCWPEASWAVLLELMRGKGLVPVLCGAPSEKADLERLTGIVRGIISIKVIYNALESGNRDIILLSEFESEEALAAYQTHPEHIEISRFVGGFAVNRSCFDYAES
jgi:ADP-heptose:LPS heptosyltransferase